ncbi:ABC transporter ATP-binding protein [Proteiniborus sp. MB09-C3]|uniref:ABC transporter ATP-binding protein n=1 Tax=Proteiniborus sp. MB09-C3 TaxID=3050072 RepID=UPI002553907D|nr:ABC transporter ATP-binding protein [Proteiniborus sp. MB09-C3]WIV13367.1 ABC transporter ATP-binding protein [Proteiniborus sp. MB09-C3]
MEIVNFENVSKTYKRTGKSALSNFTLTLKYGKILGILGPNGAGKSTFIKLLTGIIKRDSGKISVFRRDPEIFSNDDLAKFGVYMTGKSSFFELLPVIDSLKMTKAIYKVNNREFEKALHEYSEILDCGKYLNQPANTLSVGQRLRCEILNVLIHNPSLIILDEPTNGLDIEGKRKFNIMLRNLSDIQQKTVLIATHDVNSAGRLCDDMIVLKEGKKIFQISKSELEYFTSSHTVVETDGEFLESGVKAKRLPNVDNMNRYLIENSDLPTVRNNQSACFADANTIKFSQSGLEELVYEYYN